MLANLAGLTAFAGFALAGVALVFGRRGQKAPRRRAGASMFLAYTLIVSSAAGLTQRHLFPFVAWSLISTGVPPSWTYIRIVGVDAAGGEHAIDYRAWEPLSVDELRTWLERVRPRIDADARARVGLWMLEKAEAARARAAEGRAIGRYERVLGPLAAPLFLLHVQSWSSADRSPSSPFVALRLYEETWRRGAERSDGPGARRLIDEFRR